jgi:undecaprenyl-diphosphatase
LDLLLLAKAVILGIVEGLTEFLPVSSTGHLILVGDLLNFNDDKGKVFEIVIQAAAIFAVCWEYRAKLLSTFAGLRHDPVAQKFTLNLFIAFLPLAVFGLAFNKAIKALLFKPLPVALAFIIGGVIILVAERWYQARTKIGRAPLIDSVDALRWQDALKLGFAQCAALIPGTSRSGATIIGGLFFGLSRKCATEFSFFLAIPTLFAATAYSLWKERALLSMADLPLFGVGSLAAFISAFVVVRWLIRYVSSHDFTVFAWYRIAFGLVVIVTAWSGAVAWSAG